MKLSLSLDGVNKSIANLQNMGVVIESDFTGSLIDNGKRLRDKAKEILEGKVNPIYSTGNLRNSIQVKVIDKDNVEVGPDMKIAPYAEWVEFGHYMTGGWNIKGQVVKGARWWEGHHYMEGAWLEISPTIAKQVSDTLNMTLENFAKGAGRVRHKTTGRFVRGVIGE